MQPTGNQGTCHPRCVFTRFPMAILHSRVDDKVVIEMDHASAFLLVQVAAIGIKFVRDDLGVAMLAAVLNGYMCNDGQSRLSTLYDVIQSIEASVSEV